MIPSSIRKLPAPPRKPWAWIIGRLCITTHNQAANAPFIDPCTVSADNGRTYRGRSILLSPWRRDRHHQTKPQRALVLAWGRSMAEIHRAEVDRLRKESAMWKECAVCLENSLKRERQRAQQAETRLAEFEQPDPPPEIRIFADRKVIELDGHYDMSLADMRTPDELVRRIYHLSEKTWVTRDVFRAMIEFACHGHGWPHYDGTSGPPAIPSAFYRGLLANGSPDDAPSERAAGV
jgi:hypothetical protein